MDADADENGELRFELARGSGEVFRVDRRTGQVLLRQPLAAGHNTEFELLVAAYDGGTPPLSAETAVRVKVVDRSVRISFSSARPDRFVGKQSYL